MENFLDDKHQEAYFEKVVHDRNNKPLAEFEGYSPEEMHHILYDGFGPQSPIRLLSLSDADMDRIPILNQVMYLARMLEKAGEFKLTNLGFLPTKVVAELYARGFMHDDLIEEGVRKLYKETDSRTVHLARILLDIAGFTKKRLGKWSLTATGAKVLSDRQEVLRRIWIAFTSKLNWAYFDGFGDNGIGQLGLGFTLVLLSKYGGEERLDSFYADKYFQAFPNLLYAEDEDADDVMRTASLCYGSRSFRRFLLHFGLVDNRREGHRFFGENYITKTELFDRMIRCEPHGVR